MDSSLEILPLGASRFPRPISELRIVEPGHKARLFFFQRDQMGSRYMTQSVLPLLRNPCLDRRKDSVPVPTASSLANTSPITLRQGVIHGAAVATLFVLVVARWNHYLVWPEFHGDEDIYIAAFQAAAAGESPFEIAGYFYPAALASFGGWLISAFGETAVRLAMRGAVVLGLVTTVWIALSLWQARYLERLGVAAAYLALAPSVRSGLENGNLSFAVIGLILLALFLWPRRPVASGLLLGASVVAKPLAPLAILALFVHRPVPWRWQHWLAAAVAGASGAAFLLPHQLAMMTAGFSDSFSGIRTVSLVRIAALLGLELNPYWIAAAVGVGVVVLCTLRAMTPLELMSVATTAAVLSVPVVWSHTLMLTLPLQVLAVLRAARRQAVRDSGRSEVLLILLLVASIQFSAGAEALLGSSGLSQALLLAVPLLAPVGLTFYVLGTREIDDG